MLTLDGLGEPGVAGWLLVAAAAARDPPAVRPASRCSARACPRRERVFVAWFGVRGIGSLYYAAVAVGLGAFSEAEADRLTWTVIACVVVSIVVHGVTAAPLARRWLP